MAEETTHRNGFLLVQLCTWFMPIAGYLLRSAVFSAGLVAILLAAGWAATDLKATGPWTADELDKNFQVIVQFWFLVWITLATSTILVATLRTSRREKGGLPDRITARHEAAHALVACVVGLDVISAELHNPSVQDRPEGTVTIETKAGPGDDLFKILVQKMAVGISGAMAQQTWLTVEDAVSAFGSKSDWDKVSELSWVAGFIQPRRVMWVEVADILLKEFTKPCWQAAIEAAASVLLDALGKEVSGERFNAIAKEHGLSLAGFDLISRCGE